MRQKLEIIAEAGCNHNGSPELACTLIDLAGISGATSVKFQFIFAEGLYLEEYFDGSGYRRNKVFEQRKTEEIPIEDWRKIWAYASTKGMTVSASVFCERGIDMLKQLGAPYVKIASTDLTNHSLIELACSNFQRVIV